jgi:hypothetical protein
MLFNATFDIWFNAVFNVGMAQNEHADWALIAKLGGPSKVAELLEYPKEGGAQRVQNWKARGIPAAVKLARPDLFLADLHNGKPTAKKTANCGGKPWDGVERRKQARA